MEKLYSSIKTKKNPATLSLMEQKMGSSLEHMGIRDRFLNITPVAQTLRATINKWDRLKLRSFCKAKNTEDKKAAY